jgi:hypothetical protein
VASDNYAALVDGEAVAIALLEFLAFGHWEAMVLQDAPLDGSETVLGRDEHGAAVQGEEVPEEQRDLAKRDWNNRADTTEDEGGAQLAEGEAAASSLAD